MRAVRWKPTFQCDDCLSTAAKEIHRLIAPRDEGRRLELGDLAVHRAPLRQARWVHYCSKQGFQRFFNVRARARSKLKQLMGKHFGDSEV